MNRVIDLRSDTVTKPTEAMRKAMSKASVGDDVYGEDPTVNKLEEVAAGLIGKENALYVPSGTMGNLIALMAHTNAGGEVILEERAHIYLYEVGGVARLAGLIPRLVKGERGLVITPSMLEGVLRPLNIHFPATTLLCLESSHNLSGGRVYKSHEIRAAADYARQKGLKVHLDGARIFNAAANLGINVQELTSSVDSVMFCLSKGLSAPVGSILAGSREFIQIARKRRKLLGGGMRQAGVLAAAGLVALETMVDRLEEDHENARILVEYLAEMRKMKVDPSIVETNMVLAEVSETGYYAMEFVERLRKEGVLCNARTSTSVRFVTHKDVSKKDIENTINIINKVI